MKEKTTWEVKDRNYYLTNNYSPLTYTLRSKHTRRFPLMYFDNDKGYQRELRYATNMPSPFVDEQNGMATLEHIVFENGTLFVPKEKQSLQKLLSLYHPLKDKLYSEFDAVKIAEYDLDDIELESVKEFEVGLLEHFESKHSECLKEINSSGDISDDLGEKMNKAIEEFKKSF